MSWIKSGSARCGHGARRADVEIDRLQRHVVKERSVAVERLKPRQVLFHDIDRGVVEADFLFDDGKDLLDELGRLHFGGDDPADLIKEVGLRTLSVEQGLKVAPARGRAGGSSFSRFGVFLILHPRRRRRPPPVFFFNGPPFANVF